MYFLKRGGRLVAVRAGGLPRIPACSLVAEGGKEYYNFYGDAQLIIL
jgi:hypothetical protein